MVRGRAGELLVPETPQGAIVQAKVWRSLVQLGPGTDKPIGGHSRKGKVKKKGTGARSFFQEKKGWPPPPPAWPCGSAVRPVFGCPAAAARPV